MTDYLPEDKNDDISESISGNDSYNNVNYTEAAEERAQEDTI